MLTGEWGVFWGRFGCSQRPGPCLRGHHQSEASRSRTEPPRSSTSLGPLELPAPSELGEVRRVHCRGWRGEASCGPQQDRPEAGLLRLASSSESRRQSFHLQTRVRSVREDKLELAFPKVTLLVLGEEQDGTSPHTPTWVPPGPGSTEEPREQPGLLTHLSPSPWGGVTWNRDDVCLPRPVLTAGVRTGTRFHPCAFRAIGRAPFCRLCRGAFLKASKSAPALWGELFSTELDVLSV